MGRYLCRYSGQVTYRASTRCFKSRFPIGIIVFDELELILYVSQGLTLSTGSLVYFKGYIVIGGDRSFFDINDSIEVFDVKVGKWMIAQATLLMRNMKAANIDDSILIFG